MSTDGAYIKKPCVACKTNGSTIEFVAGDLSPKIYHKDGYVSPRKFVFWSKQPLDYSDYTLVAICDAPIHIRMAHSALRRMVSVAQDTGAVMVYSDRFTRMPDGTLASRPVIDCQEGSLRDDFDFGSVALFQTKALRKAVFNFSHSVCNYGEGVQYSGFYGVRLALMCEGRIVHLPEKLYTDEPIDLRASGERIFDYQSLGAVECQRELEKVCTWHLQNTGAYLPPNKNTNIFVTQGHFDVECTVVIPVLNRASVIADAIKSALDQKTDFKFNVMVVDNHSTDGTTDVIKSFTNDPRLIHIIPDHDDLGIGGCWNLAVYDERCGRFVIGLDSDDLFATPHALATMVAKFYETNAAMVVGSYRIVNYSFEEIPPGVIAHREWTDENGCNNLLRVNGIGGPRAFYTPVYRDICLPCSSYGEDYGMALMISRQYRIGRVWDVMTLARRGDDNTDSDLDITQENANNVYKDRLRTWEIQVRKALNNDKRN